MYYCSTATLYSIVQEMSVAQGKANQTRNIWMSIKREDNDYPFFNPQDFYEWIEDTVREWTDN